MQRDEGQPGNEISPPGTAIAERQNLGPGERSLSVLAGAVLGIIAARRKDGIGLVMGTVGGVLVARGLTGAAPIKRLVGQTPEERDLAAANGWSSAALVSRSVTINAARSDVYAAFRDFAAWPRFSENVSEARHLGDNRWHWVIKDPSGPVAFDASVTEEILDNAIALHSDDGTPVPINSRFVFKDAAGGRGTEVHVIVAYEPPGGSLVRYAEKLSQREPGIQMRRDLKRFKSMIEAGEVATNAPQGTKPKA